MSVTGTATVKGGSIIANFLYVPFVWCCMYLNIKHESIVILGLLLFIDFFTGVLKIYIIDRTRLRSYIALSGILSKAVVILIPIVIALGAKGVNYDLSFLVGTVISLMILAELYSIIGNIIAIKERKEVTEIDAMSIVLKRIQKAIEKYLKKKDI